MASTDQDPDPIRISQRAMRPTLPRRFYTEVAVTQDEEGRFSVRLDGRGARTTARRPLALPTQAAAEAVAQEWQAQRDVVDPSTMPMTRMVMAALDTVSDDPRPIVAEVAKYGGSDLLCYRAAEPQSLADRQTACWDPLLSWMHERYGARFVLAEGVMYAAQPQPTIEAVETAVRAMPVPFGLAAMHVLTTLSGSVVLALAVAQGRLTPEAAWAAAHVDEDHQIERWGADEEATLRRSRRFADFAAAAKLLALA
ncbi:ATP12 family chaperone protein [Chelatococcus reniformis]|uniref:ATPase n=1 Tax=Chelatococcus reniformis TaxID=1494448 RepID=A0A916XB56_9HYPH|nr:ATP12 family protein [Chelatococcus reniformis]GGC57884.1 ATPase [Chelatococcus reniformis]